MKNVDPMNQKNQESRALSAPGTHLNWRPSGVTLYESNWSILHKLAHLNRTNMDGLGELFRNWRYGTYSKVPKNVSFSLDDYGKFSQRRLQWLLKLDPQVIEY